MLRREYPCHAEEKARNKKRTYSCVESRPSFPYIPEHVLHEHERVTMTWKMLNGPALDRAWTALQGAKFATAYSTNRVECALKQIPVTDTFSYGYCYSISERLA